MRLPRSPDVRSRWRVTQVYWACIAFLGVWRALREIGITGAPLPHAALFFAVLALAAANLTLRSVSSLRPGHDGRAGFFTLADLALIVLGLRLTGGADSPLWLVLFVVVLAETVLSPSREASLICGAAGAALVAGTWSPLVPPLPYLFDIATRAFFLVAVSITTRRLRENAAAKDAEIAGLRAELAAAGERARLARDIHDGVGNALAAAVLRLEVAARVGEKPGESPAAAFQEEAGALREAMRAVRDWTFFAHPWPTGGEADLRPSEAFAREIERFGRRTGLLVTLAGTALLDDLPEPTRVAVLRITQEALTNAAKHARADHAVVALERERGAVRLRISDEGCGFDAGEPGSGVGIASMRERAEALGGRFALDAAPGAGVTLTVHLPADG